MMTHTMRVVSLQGDKAIIEHDASATSCNSCTSKAGCGAMTNIFPTPKRTLTIHNSLNAKVGQLVSIGLPVKAFTYSMCLCYLLPIAILVLSALLGDVLYDESGSIVLGLFSVLLSFIAVRVLLQWPTISTALQPRMLCLDDGTVHIAGIVRKV